jgi:hypothetical protein
MKRLNSILVLIAAGLLAAGCGKNSGSQAQGTNSALDYGNTLVNAKKTADKTIDVSYLNQALQQFNVQEGRYPKTLQELTPNYVAKIPDAPLGYKLDYDAVKGEVKVVPQ